MVFTGVEHWQTQAMLTSYIHMKRIDSFSILPLASQATL